MKIAQPPLAAARQHLTLAIANEIEKSLVSFRVVDLGPDGHPQDDVFGCGAILIAAATVLTALGPMQTGVAIIDQRIDVAISDRDDAAATAAIPPVRATLGDIFFSAEARHSVAAVTSDHFDSSLVDEFHRFGRINCARTNAGD
jgi:hypothetical protein